MASADAARVMRGDSARSCDVLDASWKTRARLLPWLWGALVSAVLCRFFFQYRPGEIHLNHEEYSYVYRLAEFLDCLRAGYVFPHWATHFRRGLGSPYFGYYQPGFFYGAALFASVLPLMKAIAVTVWAFSLLGYGAILALVRRWFGTAAGVLGGTALLLAPYSRTQLYIRGDLSEYAGTMMLAAVLCWLLVWLDTGRPAYWRATAFGAACLILLHPAAALLGYAALGAVLVCWAIGGPAPTRAFAASGSLIVGICLAAFYWLPLVLEWRFVSGWRATEGLFRVEAHFISPRMVLGLIDAAAEPVPGAAGGVVLLLAGANGLLAVWEWRRLTPPERWLIASVWVVVAAVVFAMSAAAAPAWKVPLMRLVQFPWRALLVLTIGLAVLAGAAPFARVAFAVLGIGALLWTPIRFDPGPIFHYRVLASAAGLAQQYFAPDFAGEWLPVGASVLRDQRVGSSCTSDCRMGELELAAGRLRVAVRTEGGTVVTLPHYFFPVGWKARLDGREIPLEAGPDGLMQVGVPRSGLLDVRFTMTPTHRLGVALSASTLLGLLAGIALRNRGRKSGPSGAAPRPSP